ncbi:hypothetical protein [Flavobacterium sp.]|uniref:hypothetical protein n=1 Tax=Flavobacterium sp. TaxID=239 RepID=UPI003D135773
MKDNKPKCNCAKSGVMCALKLSLMKKGETLSDATTKNKAICPLKAALFNSVS